MKALSQLKSFFKQAIEPTDVHEVQRGALADDFDKKQLAASRLKGV